MSTRRLIPLTLTGCVLLALIGCARAPVAPTSTPSAAPAPQRTPVRFAFFIAKDAPAGMSQAPTGKRLLTLPDRPDVHLLADAQPQITATRADVARLTYQPTEDLHVPPAQAVARGGPPPPDRPLC